SGVIAELFTYRPSRSSSMQKTQLLLHTAPMETCSRSFCRSSRSTMFGSPLIHRSSLAPAAPSTSPRRSAGKIRCPPPAALRASAPPKSPSDAGEGRGAFPQWDRARTRAASGKFGVAVAVDDVEVRRTIERRFDRRRHVRAEPRRLAAIEEPRAREGV